MSTPRDALENAVQHTLPIPVGVSGLTILGFTLQDWVFIGTGVLLVFQIIVMAPKAVKAIRELFKGG